ncbi:hypothetical protein, partial [Klebsiella pneumoniae]|uniref:hypothetical protein n=1 Tax=Klebsiella pneumoniae TaxID=573 RepID=UPI001C207C6C
MAGITALMPLLLSGPVLVRAERRGPYRSPSANLQRIALHCGTYDALCMTYAPRLYCITPHCTANEG